MVTEQVLVIAHRLKRHWWAINILIISVLLVACSTPDSNDTAKDPKDDDTKLTGPEEGSNTANQSQDNFDMDATGLETYAGLPVGFTEEGYPFRGNPAAPVTLVEFSDYLCPFCGRYFNQTHPELLANYGVNNQVKFVFHDFPLVALHPTAPIGHAAALCVSEQGAALFWEMHDQLFGTQQQWANLGDPSEHITNLAQSIGVDMDVYKACMADGRTKTLVDERVALGQALGFNGTPTFQVISNTTGTIHPLVGAQPLQTFAATIDAVLSNEGDAALASSPSETNTDPETLTQINFDVEGLDLETYLGLPVGFTEEGYPFRGNPEAELTLIEFSDYLCPFCGRHFNTTYPELLQTYGADGEINFVFRDLPLASLHPTAHFGHEAALCVAEQGAALFWEMHDQLFATQQQWANLPDPTDFVTELAATSGADMTAYETCIAAGETGTLVNEYVAAGQALGFNGTPTFQVLVNGSEDIYPVSGAQPYQVFADLLDTLLAGETPEEPAELDPAELPFWANEQGLVPDPDRPGYTLAGDPFKGDPEAAVVVVEFSDFQCPACQQHALEIQPALDEQLVETGDMMWVYKNIPLKEHPQALDAAVAAECAGNQGQFWQMHHLLFENIDQWTTEDTEAGLSALAESLGLNMDTYAACVNGRSALESIVQDIYDAQGVAQTTPTFIALHDGQGTLINGSRPIDGFIALLRSFLAP